MTTGPPPAAALHLRTATAEETRAVGAGIATLLRPGDVVVLTGELGAGKTCLVQGAARGLGVTARVTSPSFLLRRDYRGDVPIIHLDVYRLDTLAEVADLGYEDVGEQSAVAFIEWGDAMAPLLPADHLEVDLRLGDPAAAGDLAADEPAADELEEERAIVLRARGDDWRRRMDALADALTAWRDGKAG